MTSGIRDEGHRPAMGTSPSKEQAPAGESRDTADGRPRPEVHPRREFSHPVKVLLVTGGFISFIVGIIGLLIPVFPTSPFIILAAALFFEGSDRWYNWLLNHRWFGPYVRDYRERGGMRRVPKYLFLLTVWVAVGVSTVVALDALWHRLLLLAFGVALSTWVLRLKSL